MNLLAHMVKKADPVADAVKLVCQVLDVFVELKINLDDKTLSLLQDMLLLPNFRGTQ